MATTLKIVEKNSALKQVWRGYIQDNGMMKEYTFVLAKEPVEKVYDLFFSKKPKVKIRHIDAQKSIAQQLYETLTFNMVSSGQSVEAAHNAAVKDKRFGAIFESSKKAIAKKLDALADEFLGSKSYERFLQTRVDGASLAAQMGMHRDTAAHLMHAKVSMIRGAKTDAKAHIKKAVQEQARKIAKMKQVPRGYTPLTEKQAEAKLAKIKIAL